MDGEEDQKQEKQLGVTAVIPRRKSKSLNQSNRIMSGEKYRCEEYMVISRPNKYLVVRPVGEKDIKDDYLISIETLMVLKQKQENLWKSNRQINNFVCFNFKMLQINQNGEVYYTI